MKELIKDIYVSMLDTKSKEDMGWFDMSVRKWRSVIELIHCFKVQQKQDSERHAKQLALVRKRGFRIKV